jgi:hypothetical protein
MPITFEGLLSRVQNEIVRGEEKHGPLNSHHEAYAVLLEEVDEYWHEVKRQQRIPGKLRDELIQIAAVALRAAMMDDA